MLENLLGSLVDKEKAIYNTIQVTLESLTEELNCSANDFFIMIKPTDEKGNFKCWIFKNNEKGAPQKIRELPLREIIGD